MTVSVMLRCSQQEVSSSALDLPQSLREFEGGAATLFPNQPSHSEDVDKGNREITCLMLEIKVSYHQVNHLLIIYIITVINYN